MPSLTGNRGKETKKIYADSFNNSSITVLHTANLKNNSIPATTVKGMTKKENRRLD
jgi:hypothetical protein